MEDAASVIGPDVPVYLDYIEAVKTVASYRKYTRPHHHLEALASVLEVECGNDCIGGKIDECDLQGYTTIPCSCKGTGKQTILQQWEADNGQ
jgi:hypothetical protein